METLSQKTYGYLEANVLNPAGAPHLLYNAVQLTDRSAAFGELCERAEVVLRRNLSESCQSPENFELICHLPFDILNRMLVAEDLNVTNEGCVLKIIQHALRERGPQRRSDSASSEPI